MTPVAVLFARADSVYKTLPGCDVYDIERDARTWPGGCPVVAHPPCRAWGRLHYFAQPREDEPELALTAVDLVRRWGGVLEHPAYSKLWLYRMLPAPDAVDEWGGITVPIVQRWWGHRADKATWLYVVGVSRRELPQMPLILGRAPYAVSPGGGMRKGDTGWRPSIRKDEREHTPPELARWLVELARRVRMPQEIAA
jgi:hypothetical protein